MRSHPLWSHNNTTTSSSSSEFLRIHTIVCRGALCILLANFFLKNFLKNNDLGGLKISKDAKSKLLSYSFPGNVRELKAIIELAAVLTNEEEITENDIKFNSPKKGANFLTDELTFEEYKKVIVTHFLEKYNNDIDKVASKLDIGKSTIYRMLKNEKVCRLSNELE